MADPRELTAPVRFGAFEFDPATFRLRRDGVTVPLEPKVLALLQLFLERAPRVVDKAEIFAVVWKDVAVTDNALTRAVAQLRKVLEDDPKSPRYLETVATRGYRWMEPIDRGVPGDAVRHAGDRRGEQGSRAGYAIAILAVLFVTVIGWLGLQRWTTASALGDAVRPFPSAATLAALRPVQMTTGSGYDGYMAFSPDGKSIAFSSDRTGALEIYVQGTAPGSVAMRLTTGSGQFIQPTWSPDGQIIAYHDMAGDGIWVVPSRGGVPRRVSDYGSHPAWSPDGRRLAFHSLSSTQVNAIGTPGVPVTVGVVPADGSSPPTPITAPGVPEGPHMNPAWLDDGHVIFVAARENPESISYWSVDLESRQPQLFAEGDHLSSEFVLTPDRARVFFAGRNTSAIWQMPLVSSGVSSGGAEPTGLPTTGPFISSLTLSGDGRHIGWTSMEITGHVWAYEASRANGAVRARPITKGPGVRYTNPSPSADGRLIVNGIRAGAPYTVYLLEDGKEPRPLTPHPGAHSGAHWLPGGREALIVGFHDDVPTLFALDPATGRERRLFAMADLPQPPGDRVQQSTAGAFVNLAFAPDFRRVARAVLRDGVLNLWVAGLRDEKPDGSLVQVTFERDGGGYPAWSRDGRWIAYQCAEGTNIHACALDMTTGERRQLTHEPGLTWIGGWGPDGPLVAARRAGVWNVAEVSIATGVTRQLTRFTDATSYVRYPDWDAAHRRVLFERSEQVGRAWAIELPD